MNVKVICLLWFVFDYDSLCDVEIVGVFDEIFLFCDCVLSNCSLLCDFYVFKNVWNRSNSYDFFWDLNGLYDGDSVFKFLWVFYGCFLRVSVLGDSCVLIFLFFLDGFVRLRDSYWGGKWWNLIVEFERGFDSGFFGLEGSWIFWGNELFDILLIFNCENKFWNVILLE